MAEVFDLSTLKNMQLIKARQKIESGNLTEMIKAATILRQNAEEIKETIVVTDFEGLKRIFEARLSDIILKTKNIGVDFFLCSNYIAALLVEIGSISPESWFAVDYFLKAATEDAPTALKQGANICFLICAVFPLRGQIRCMKLNDYEVLGKGMFYNYYNQTGKVVAYYMSQQFKPMAEITKECLQELK